MGRKGGAAWRKMRMQDPAADMLTGQVRPKLCTSHWNPSNESLDNITARMHEVATDAKWARPVARVPNCGPAVRVAWASKEAPS